MNSRTIKKKNQELLKTKINLEESLILPRKKEIKFNFKLNSKLTSDLFKQEDTKKLVTQRSDEIVSFLSLSKKFFPVDIYPESTNIIFEELDSEFKRIFTQEFAEAIKDIEQNEIRFIQNLSSLG